MIAFLAAWLAWRQRRPTIDGFGADWYWQQKYNLWRLERPRMKDFT